MSIPPQTPQKAHPGAFIQTPAMINNKPSSVSYPNLRSVAPSSQEQHGAQGNNQAVGRPPPQQNQTATNRPVETLQPIERAARTITEMLNQEAQYPELDSYIGRA